MKLPRLPSPLKIIKWLLPKSKRQKRDEFLVREYEKGRILQVDNNKDNKKFLLNLETA